MTGAAALDLLMARLGNRTSVTLRATVLLEMALAQDNFFERLSFVPWFLREDYTDATFLTVVDQEYVNVPTDHLRLDEEWGGLFWKDTTLSTPDQWKRITKDAYPEFKEYYFEGATGDPERFDIIGTRIYLRPIPSAAVLLRLMHLVKDDAPTDAPATNLWLTYAQSWLISETGFQMAAYHLGDSARAEVFAASLAQAKANLLIETEARKHAGQSYTMGDM